MIFESWGFDSNAAQTSGVREHALRKMVVKNPVVTTGIDDLE